MKLLSVVCTCHASAHTATSRDTTQNWFPFAGQGDMSLEDATLGQCSIPLTLFAAWTPKTLTSGCKIDQGAAEDPGPVRPAPNALSHCSHAPGPGTSQVRVHSQMSSVAANGGAGPMREPSMHSVQKSSSAKWRCPLRQAPPLSIAIPAGGHFMAWYLLLPSGTRTCGFSHKFQPTSKPSYPARIGQCQ